jgi:hypothetical protein
MCVCRRARDSDWQVAVVAQICENQVSAQELEPQGFCDICHTSFINRTTAITVTPNLSLVPTLRYRVRVCVLGFGLGRHLYSTTLVPGEEIELEIFRSTKTTDELSKETSIEETFSQELSSTIQDEWSDKQSSNFKIGGGVTASLDLGIFSIGGHVEPEYSTQEETFQKTFAEFVRKSQAKTDRKFDVRMDIKTETVSSERSTRKLRNFNQCQPVTYNYFQLMRRMKLELIVDALTFDVVDVKQQPLHPVFTASLGALLNVARFTPPRSQEILSAISVAPPPVGVAAAVAPALAAAAAGPPLAVVAQATVRHPVVADDFNRPVRQLTLEQLEKLVIPGLDQAVQQPVRDLAEGLAKQFPVGTVVVTEEFCVNTTGVTVEAVTGRCLACDTHTGLVQDAEVDKLRADLLKEKLADVESGVHGFVRSVSGPVAGAVVRLQHSSTVLGETVTDSDGLYILSVKGLAGHGDNISVDVPTLPAGLTGAQPPQATFKAGDVPVQVDFVAS